MEVGQGFELLPGHGTGECIAAAVLGLQLGGALSQGLGQLGDAMLVGGEAFAGLRFGFLSGVAILGAMVADLVVLPALVTTVTALRRTRTADSPSWPA